MVGYQGMDVSISYDFRINKKTLYCESALEILIKQINYITRESADGGVVR